MKLGALAVGIRSGGGGVGRVGGPSLGSSRGISVSRPGFTSVRSFGPVASRIKPAGQGFGRGPESRNSAPIRAESKWAKPSPKWNFLKNAPRLTLGTPRSASEASFRSVKPIAETKPIRSAETKSRFNPYNQKGRERFAYRQTAQIIEFPSVRTTPQVETKRLTETHIHIEQRVLAERRARSLQKLQPLIDAGVLTSAQANQAVETAVSPQTRTNNKTKTRLEAVLQTIKKDTEVATEKKVKRAIRAPQKRNNLNKREIVYQQDQVAQNATNAGAKRVIDEISRENKKVTGNEFAERFRFSRRMRSRLLDQLGRRDREDGRWDNLYEDFRAQEEITPDKSTALNEKHTAVELRDSNTAPQVGERAVIEVLDQGSEEVNRVQEGNSVETTKRSALRVLIEKTFNEEYQPGQDSRGLKEIISEPVSKQAEQRKVTIFGLYHPVDLFKKEDNLFQQNLIFTKAA